MLRFSVVVVLALMVLGGEVRADDTDDPSAGHTPTFLLTTDWGMKSTLEPSFLDDGSTMLGIAGTGGLMMTIRKPTKHTIYFADAKAFFLGGVYGGRVGLITGHAYNSHYSELISSTSSTVGNVTTTTNTFAIYPQTINGVMGLDLSVSATTFGAGDYGNFVLEAGFALMGQSAVEFQFLYNVIDNAPGLRVNTIYAMGGRGGHFAFRMDTQIFFNFDSGTAMLLTFGLGGGSGFDWK